MGFFMNAFPVEQHQVHAPFSVFLDDRSESLEKFHRLLKMEPIN
jgi:hypothetical protein